MTFVTGQVLTAAELNSLDTRIGSLESAPVTNITALKGLDKTKVPYAHTNGYWTAGDGGDGAYWYDAADTTSTDNGGTIIVATDGGRRKLLTHNYVNVKQFGAKGDNIADDAAAIQAAVDYVASVLAGYGVVYFPPGKYRVLSQIWVQTSGTVFLGEGINVSKIYSWVDGDVTLYVGLKTGTTNIVFNLKGIGFEYAGTLPSSAGTKGIEVRRLVAPSIIDDFSIQKFLSGMKITGHLVGNMFISNFVIGNVDYYGIELAEEVQGVWIHNGKIYARNDGVGPIATSIGMTITSALGVYIRDLDIVVNNRGIVINPTATDLVQWIFMSGVNTDSNTAAGVDIVPTGGVVYGVQMNGCWTSSNGGNGITLRGSTGSVVDGITICNETALNNDRAGLEINLGSGGSVKNVKLDGGMYMSNNQGLNTLPAIAIGAGATHFTINGITAGTIQSHANNQTYGIRVYAGASDNYMITNNMLIGNVSGTLLDDGTGINKVIANNL